MAEISPGTRLRSGFDARGATSGACAREAAPVGGQTKVPAEYPKEAAPSESSCRLRFMPRLNHPRDAPIPRFRLFLVGAPDARGS